MSDSFSFRSFSAFRKFSSWAVPLMVLAMAWASPGFAQVSPIPIKDTQLFAGPAGAGTINGPTPKGEMTVLREQFFTTTAPDMSGSGISLGTNSDNDGLYSQSIFFRCGPVFDKNRDPDCRGTITFPASVNIIGIVVADAELDNTDITLGLAPGVDYTADWRGIETQYDDSFNVATLTDGRVEIQYQRERGCGDDDRRFSSAH
ncbi:MAG: hypothetical protein GY822_11935 [Deltaproteobacteria bacterium]|nr:hypothetical protein [Deltaproteobacteria bacterium]